MIILPLSMQQAKEESDVFFIELYRCHFPSGIVYIAACDEKITFNGIEYLPLPIERGDIKTTVDSKVDNVELKIGNVTQDFTLALYQGLDFRGSNVEIITILYPQSLTNPDIFKYTFVGYVDSPYFDGKEFRCTIKARVPNIDVPLRKFQLPCNAWFGDPVECGKTKITNTSTMLANSTQNIIRDNNRNEVSNYWQHGIATYHSESRKVIESGNGYFKVDYPFTYAVSNGASYTIETGCDKTVNTCKNRHNNLSNYSGFPAIPFEMKVIT